VRFTTNYAIPSYYSIELWSVNMLHEHKLHSKSRTSEQFFFFFFATVQRVDSMSTDNILMRIV
jgi:hypothetical protein